MKKFISGILALLTITACLSACDSNTDTTRDTVSPDTVTEEVDVDDDTSVDIEDDTTDEDIDTTPLDENDYDDGIVDTGSPDVNVLTTVPDEPISVVTADTAEGDEDFVDEYADNTGSDCCTSYASVCPLTRDDILAERRPEIDYYTKDELDDFLSVLTLDEYSAAFPTEDDYNTFIQIASGRDGNIFRNGTLSEIATYTSDPSIYVNADCDIVFDYAGYENTPVAVYYSYPKFLAYDWALCTATAFDWDADALKAFCDSDYYNAAKATNNSEDLNKVLREYGLEDPIMYWH
jgi:hypothetical protein